MKIPKKIIEKEVLSNPYVKVIEKVFLEKNWKEKSFIILANTKNIK